MSNADGARQITLTDFLLARIAEDAAADCHLSTCITVDKDWMCDCRLPARVLAECKAKRRIVGIVQGLGGHYEPDAARMAPEIIRHLSLPYSAHPDYRQEWKP